MKQPLQFCLFLALFCAISCSKAEHKPATVPKVETPALAVALDEMPDIQTLTENHKILTIRVSGDLSKLTEATRVKISTQTTAFNNGLAQFKAAISHRDEIQAKLKALEAKIPAGASKSAEEQTEIANILADLKAANEAANTSKEQYDESQRQFVQLIELVKGERAGH